MKVFVITSQARGFEAVASTKAKANQLAKGIKTDLQLGGNWDDRIYIKETEVK